MRVTGLSIDGFGIFNSYEIRDLPAGLTVMYGPNEAGKSTLLAFLRGALFGFPRPTRNRRLQYPPLAGGRHGGRVFLETGGGKITIEREVGRPVRILLEGVSGLLSELSDLEFQQLIGGVDDQTFRTVFAFSLDELRDFETLTGEQVRARIFAAGVGGAGPSVREVVQGMERTCGQLLKPRSREGQINRVLSEIVACEQKLQEARALSESYPVLLEEKETVRARLKWLEDREQELRNTQGLHERLLDLWPVWVDIDAGRAELESLDPIDEFIPDGARRLVEAREGLESAQKAFVRLDERLGRHVEELDQLRASLLEEIWLLAPAVEKQSGLLPVYRDRLRESEAAQNRVAAAEERLGRSLRDLGPSANEDALRNVDTSLPRLEEVRAWRVRLDEAGAQARQAVERYELAGDQRAKATVERDREQEALQSLQQVDREALAARARAVRSLRAGITDLRARQAALEARTSAAAAIARSGARGGPGREGQASSLIAAVVVSALLLIATIVLALAGSLVATVVLAVMTVLGVALCLVLIRSRPGETRPRPIDWVQQERAAQETLKAEIEALRAEMEPAAGTLGIADLDDIHELERIDALLAEDQLRATEWSEKQAAFERAVRRFEDAELEETVAFERLERAKEEQRGLERDFRHVMAAWGLPEELSIEGVEEFLRSLSAAKELAARRDEDLVQLARLRQETTGWEEESLRLVEAANAAVAARLGVDDRCEAPFVDEEAADRPGEDAVARQTLESTLSKLAEACRAEVDIRNRIADLENYKRELEMEIEQARLEVVDRTGTWEELLRQGGARDESEFAQRLAIYEKREELKQRIAVRENALVKSIGRGQEAETFRTILVGGEVSTWEESLRDAKEEIERIRSESVLLTKSEGDIERRLEVLERSADVPSLETSLEGLRSELDALLEEWRVLQLAGLLIRDTLAQFTQERQPMVLAEASSMFERVTRGRYTRVQRSVDGEGIVVAQVDGQVKSPDELSRGAAEQLYLCLRLGLAEEFARRAEPMPLVMDDVLVNFDDARRRTTAELLAEFSERHQILLFTCHDEIVQIIRDLPTDARIIDLA